MPRTATASGYIYVKCPECHQGIQTPFAITGPQPYVHHVHRPREYGGESRCRVMVWPDPNGARAYRIPQGMSMEQATTEATKKWREIVA